MNPFQTTPRKRLTDQQKAKLFLERGGRCHRCRRKLRVGDIWTDEHVLSLENGGTNDWDNRDICCSWCFKPKNAEDRKQAAKSRAVATRNIVPEATRQKSRLAKPQGMKWNWRRSRYERELE